MSNKQKFFSKLLYDIPLSKKLIYLFLLVVLIPILLLGSLSFYIITDSIEEAAKENHFNNIETLNNMIDFNYEMYMYKADAVYGNVPLQEILMKDHKNIVEVQESYVYINYLISSITFDLNYASSKYSNDTTSKKDIAIKIFTLNETLTPDDEYIFNIEAIKDESWVNDVLEDTSFNWNIIDKDERKIVLSKRLLYFKTLEPIGLLTIEIPVATITQMINNNISMQDKSFAYFDGSEEIVSSSENSVLAGIRDNVFNNEITTTFNENNQTYVMSKIKSKITGYDLAVAIPIKHLKQSSNTIVGITIVVTLLALVLTVIASILISKITVFRLKLLMKKIRKLEKDYYSPLDNIDGTDEIGELDTVFNNMINKIKELIEIEYKSKITRDSTKLELLQEQINPHLLYNTLSAIGWQSKKSGDVSVFDTTNSLIRFYRTSLNRGDIIINLKQELEMSLEYISIMKYTYELDFDVNIDIDKDVYKYYCIKLLFQPIIENAIMHGIRVSPYKGLLCVKCYLEDGNIITKVLDNGAGMEVELISNLLNSKVGNEKGYGLSNVIKRLNLYYKDKHDIQIISEKDKGTEVVVTIEAMDKRGINDYLSDNYLL